MSTVSSARMSMSVMREVALQRPQTADISMSTLRLYVGINKAEWDNILARGAVHPDHVMRVTPQRWWVPLRTTLEAALERASWGGEEVGHEWNINDVLVLVFEFSTKGLGHYMLNQTLTTRDGNHYRFHGSLPLLSISTTGELLAQAVEMRSVN